MFRLRLCVLGGWGALLLSALAWPLETRDVLFYAPFDGDVTPALAQGDRTPQMSGEPQFIPGKRGQAVVCQDQKFRLSYPAAGHLNPACGSLSLWAAPVDWRHGDGKHHNFLTIRGEPTYLLYSFLSAPTYFLQLVPGGANIAIGADVPWQPGEWHHLAVTWQEKEFCFYVDGKLSGMNTETMALPRRLGEMFDVGSHNFGCQDATAFDELILFRRALSPPEIAALYDWIISGQAAQAPGQPVPALTQAPVVQARLRHFPSAGDVEITLRPTGAGLPENQPLPVAIVLQDEAGRELARQQRQAPLGKPTYVHFAVGTYAPGKYRIIVQPAEGPAETLLLERRPTPEWLGNTLGLEDSAPAPWTPPEIIAEGRKIRIRVWGREYVFGEGLCEQIVTQGQALLSAPLSFSLTLPADNARVDIDAFDIAARSPEAVKLSCRGTLGPLRLEGALVCEFDGFMWLELNLLPPPAGLALKGLSLDIPFTKEGATLFYSGVYYPSLDNGTGAVRPEGFQGSWRPWLWLGNERGGLQWLAEEHRDWRISQPQEAVQIRPGDKNVLLRLQIIDAPVRLQQPLHIAFGLQATPVKPPRPDRRRWRVIGQQPGVGLEKAYMLPADRRVRGLTLWNEGWTETWMIPKPRPTAKDYIARQEQAGIRPCMYLATHTLDPREEYFRYYWEEWRRAPGTPYNPAWGQSTDYYVEAPICQASSYQDYFVWLLARALESTNLKAVYFDNSVPGECANPFHGCGVPAGPEMLPAGADKAAVIPPSQRPASYWRGRTPILAARQLYKRVYRLMRAHDPESFIAIHMSGFPVMALQSFCDIMIDGENFTTYMQVLKQEKGWDNYYHTLPLDVMRAQYRNHWGPDTAFLPEFARALGKDWNQETPHTIASVEHLIGLFFLHDSGIWPCWSTLEPYGRFFAAQDRFGWDEHVRFVPYWEAAELATIETAAELAAARPADEAQRPGNPPLVMSLYIRPERIMFVPFNNTDADLAVTIRWEKEKLGLGAVAELQDYFRGTKIAANGAQASFTLPKRNFAMLVAERE